MKQAAQAGDVGRDALWGGGGGGGGRKGKRGVIIERQEKRE